MIYLLAVCGIRKRAHTRRALFSLQAGFNVAVYIAYKISKPRSPAFNVLLLNYLKTITFKKGFAVMLASTVSSDSDLIKGFNKALATPRRVYSGSTNNISI